MTTKKRLLNKIIPLKDNDQIDLWDETTQYFQDEYRIDKGYSLFLSYSLKVQIDKLGSNGEIKECSYQDLKIESAILCFKNETQDQEFFNKEQIKEILLCN